jgi:dCMP deaminase
LPIYDELTIEGLKGRNIPFCFKDIKNNLDGEKNQVHTRALHAEENAFLQLSKYGNEGILGGFLFTTSSPCELCAKKAVQLGIKKIFYIDPYPGISEQHILSSQNSSHLLELFSGAIGRAYHQLYEPIMPYKDELELMINFRVEDPYQKLQNEIDRLNRELENKENIIIGLGESLKAQQRH